MNHATAIRRGTGVIGGTSDKIAIIEITEGINTCLNLYASHVVNVAGIGRGIFKTVVLGGMSEGCGKSFFINGLQTIERQWHCTST